MPFAVRALSSTFKSAANQPRKRPKRQSPQRSTLAIITTLQNAAWIQNNKGRDRFQNRAEQTYAEAKFANDQEMSPS